MSGSLLLVGLVTFVALPPAVIAAVLVHELAHAVAGRALGFVVTRIEIVEGRELARFGHSPQVVLGAIPGSGWTHAVYLGHTGYRWRWVTFSLAAPPASAAAALGAWFVSTDWPLYARTAALVFAALNLMMAVVTLIPAPTFGGRVWSDLALSLAAVRMTDKEIGDDRAGRAAEHVQSLTERGETGIAVEVAEDLRKSSPDAAVGWSALAFALASDGRPEEAAAVARDGLAREDLDDETRAYLALYLAGDVTPGGER